MSLYLKSAPEITELTWLSRVNQYQMLKSLLSKIKSQKTQSNADQSQDTLSDRKEVFLEHDLSRYHFGQLTEQNRVKCSVGLVRYSVEFEAPSIYQKVLACPVSSFTHLPHAKRKVKEIDLRKDVCPEYINPLKNILSRQLPTFNHLLINVYPPGCGIMPHFDGPMYCPKVVVLSLGGPAIISFSESYGSQISTASVLLQDKSVHIFEKEAYERCLHGIKDYPVESVYLKIARPQGEEAYQVQRASVDNFPQTRLRKILFQNVILGDQKFDQNKEYDLSDSYGVSCNLNPISDNPEYNCKVQISRKERISITVRQKTS